MVANVFQSSSSVLSSIQRRMSSISWKLGFLIVIVAIIGCQSQTFQYSRGWTNGKRSGNNFAANQPSAPASSSSKPGSGQQSTGSLLNQMYDDGSVIGIDESSVPISTAAGTFRLFPSIANRADGKGRSVDYSQFLTRKLGNGSNPNRKPPMWIVGLDQDNNNEDF